MKKLLQELWCYMSHIREIVQVDSLSWIDRCAKCDRGESYCIDYN